MYLLTCYVRFFYLQSSSYSNVVSTSATPKSGKKSISATTTPTENAVKHGKIASFLNKITHSEKKKTKKELQKAKVSYICLVVSWNPFTFFKLYLTLHRNLYEMWMNLLRAFQQQMKLQHSRHFSLRRTSNLCDQSRPRPVAITRSPLKLPLVLAILFS